MSPEEMARNEGGGEGTWLRDGEREPLLGVPCDDTSRVFDKETLDMAAEVHASDPFLVAIERDGTVHVLVDESALAFSDSHPHLTAWPTPVTRD